MTWRDQFHIPVGPDGSELIYLCGNSLGLQPKGAADRVSAYLERWAADGVEGWFEGADCWYSAADRLRPHLAQIVGATTEEVVLTATLTTNLHYMLTSFYRPQGKKNKVIIDTPTFPSDLYAIKSQIELHSLDPNECLISVRSIDEAESLLKSGDVALVLFNGVNFLTGELFDMAELVRIGHHHGALVGFDLAHAVGNVPLALHDWNADFAVWCHYKYLCGGPGSPGGLFVHARHSEEQEMARLAGWWGNDPKRRFEMQLQPDFFPQAGAAGWQLSAAPFLSMAPLEASLPLIASVGMAELRKRSLSLTARLEQGLRETGAKVLTPADPTRRGCQLTFECNDAQALLASLKQSGVICDFRPPSMIRLAPKPLYNTEADVDRLIEILAGQPHRAKGSSV